MIAAVTTLSFVAKLHLAEQERTDGAVIIFVALDGGAGRRDPGQFQIFHGAMGHADDFGGQVSGASDLWISGTEHSVIERRGMFAERDDFSAFQILAQAGSDQVDLLGLQIRRAIGAGDRAEYRKVLRHRHFQHAALDEIVQCIGAGGCAEQGCSSEHGDQNFLEFYMKTTSAWVCGK